MLLAQCGRRLLRRLSRCRLKRGVFQSVVHLQAAINRFVAETNAEPKPFAWTADPTKSSPPSDEGTKRSIPSASLNEEHQPKRSSVCSQLLDKFEMYSRRLPVFANGDAVVALELR